MWETLRNAWKIADLRKKILYTLFMLLLYRVLCFIPTPGINVAAVRESMGNISLLEFMNTMTGANLQNFTIIIQLNRPFPSKCNVFVEFLPIVTTNLDFNTFTSRVAIKPNIYFKL